MNFETHSSYANHIRWKHKDNHSYLKNAREATLNVFEKKAGPLITETTNCAVCGKELEFSYRPNAGKKHIHRKKEKYFCSTKCSHTRVFSDEVKETLRRKSIELWKDPEYAARIIKNNTLQQKRFSSKGEEELRNRINEIFENKFTFGGALKVGKDIYFSRDCYSEELKVCIEYDGICHFKDIWGQLAEKKMKDKLLKKWCKKNGYLLIRVKEEVYKQNKELIINSIVNDINSFDKKFVTYY